MSRAGWVGVCLLVGGCHAARGPQAAPVPPAMLASRPLAMMLPLSNLSGRLEEGDMATQVFFAEFARAWPGPYLDLGEAKRLADAVRLRDTSSPNANQVRALRDSSGAAFLLVGTVLESGTIRTPEGDVPSVGVALRLIDTATQRSVWADSRFSTGQDHESLFGWGREMNSSRLTSQLAKDMFAAFRNAAPDTLGGGSR